MDNKFSFKDGGKKAAIAIFSFLGFILLYLILTTILILILSE